MGDIPVDDRGAERPIEATEPTAAETEAPEVPLQVVEKPEAESPPEGEENELPPGVKELEVKLPSAGNVHEIMIAQLQAINNLLVQMVNHQAALRNEIRELMKKGS
jgi:hypothetical protein